MAGEVGDFATLSNNAAFGDMLGMVVGSFPSAFTTDIGPAAKNGANISIAEISADGTISGRFTDPVWTTQNARLPGLFGSTVAMPTHLGGTSIVSRDREIPLVVRDTQTAVVAPVSVQAAAFFAGPVPAQKSDGVIKIFASGKSIVSGTLTIYDATGNVVRKIDINANGAALALTNVTPVPRTIAVWDLRDATGRAVAEGTYLLRGVVRTADGRREKVSIIIGVR